ARALLRRGTAGTQPRPRSRRPPRRDPPRRLAEEAVHDGQQQALSRQVVAFSWYWGRCSRASASRALHRGMAGLLGTEVTPLRVGAEFLVGQPDRPLDPVGVGVDAEPPGRPDPARS